MNGNLVLRDIGVEAVPYSLQRRIVPPPASAEQPLRVATAQTLESQLADRYEQGFLAGRAAACEAATLQQRDDEQKALWEIRERAAQEGYADGVAQAQEQAEAVAHEAKLEVARQAKVLDTLGASLSEQIAQAIDDNEEDLVGLCHNVVCRILGQAAPTPEAVRAMLAEAVKLAGGKPVSIHVHPDDLALYQANCCPQDPDVKWVSDSGIVLGGVRVGAERTSLDATFDRQLAVLANTLAAARSAAKRGEAPV